MLLFIEVIDISPKWMFVLAETIQSFHQSKMLPFFSHNDLFTTIKLVQRQESTMWQKPGWCIALFLLCLIWSCLWAFQIFHQWKNKYRYLKGSGHKCQFSLGILEYQIIFKNIHHIPYVNTSFFQSWPWDIWNFQLQTLNYGKL